MNLINHGRIGYESSSSSKKKEKEKKTERKTCSLARSFYSRGCSNYREKSYQHLINNDIHLQEKINVHQQVT